MPHVPITPTLAKGYWVPMTLGTTGAVINSPRKQRSPPPFLLGEGILMDPATFWGRILFDCGHSDLRCSLLACRGSPARPWRTARAGGHRWPSLPAPVITSGSLITLRSTKEGSWADSHPPTQPPSLRVTLQETSSGPWCFLKTPLSSLSFSVHICR